MRKVLMTALILITATAVWAQQKFMVSGKETDKGVAMAEELIKMRSRLAATYVKQKGIVNEDTSKKICIAVAEKAKSLALEETEKRGVEGLYIIKFVSERSRNPANVADEDEMQALRHLDERRNKKEDWTEADIDDKKYYRYMKPIFAERPCLLCHGDKKKIPEFIKRGYPGDKSFGFKEGDFMGGVVVFTWKGW